LIKIEIFEFFCLFFKNEKNGLKISQMFFWHNFEILIFFAVYK